MPTPEETTLLSNALAAALAQQLGPVLTEITKLATRSEVPKGMVDSRGMGRPPSFDGQERYWREWRGKVTAYLVATDVAAEYALKWTEQQSVEVTQGVLELECQATHLVNGVATPYTDQAKLDGMHAFSRKLYLVLMDTCKGEPFRLVESAGSGFGLEAWRLLTRRYASRTPGTRRALLQSLFNMKPATSAENFETVLLNMEEMVRRYNGMATAEMPEDIKCAILVACCPADLKAYLDMSTEEFVYQDLRSRANMWIERKRDAGPKNLAQMEQRNSTGPSPMDVSHMQHQWCDDWANWGEYDVQGVQEWGGYQESSADTPWYEPAYAPEDMQYVYKGKGGKSGKGFAGKGHKGGMGKGFKGGAPKGGKGGKAAGGKGGPKGSGKGKGTFQGECHWCGVWGHPARLCRQKDAYMENMRQQGYTANIEELPPAPSPGPAPLPCKIEGLEVAGTYRDMNTTFELGTILRRNRFAALASSDEEIPFDAHEFPPLVSGKVHNSNNSFDTLDTHACGHMPKRPRATSKQWRRTKPLETVHESELGSVEGAKKVVLTIDSGAAEHVVGPTDLPHIPTRPSESRATYTMANGAQTTGQGEQHVSAVTPTGQMCNFKAQVTGVRRPLMSVSRICDGGNTVFFNSSGGYIQSVVSGERIHFKRENNVYRLSVEVPAGDFPRQGSSTPRRL